MSKSLKVHYENKYPGGRVQYIGEGSLDVYGADGRHKVALRDGTCCSKQLGCDDAHDLAPMPKNARFRKLFKDGTIGNAEEYDERVKVAQDLASRPEGGAGKVPSIADLIAAGHRNGDDSSFGGEQDKPSNWTWKGDKRPKAAKASS